MILRSVELNGGDRGQRLPSLDECTTAAREEGIGRYIWGPGGLSDGMYNEAGLVLVGRILLSANSKSLVSLILQSSVSVLGLELDYVADCSCARMDD